MHYLWMQKVEKKIGVFMVTVKRKAVRGRTIELCEMRITENEITFLLGAGTGSDKRDQTQRAQEKEEDGCNSDE